MKRIIKKITNILLTPLILKDYFRYKKTDNKKRFSLKLSNFYPQIKDKTITTGFDRHYVYHTSWAARVLSETRPSRHIDISSSLYFSGIVSAFIPIDFYDYRPAKLGLTNLSSNKGDLMSLPFKDNSLKSISCMHTIEHIGLGRYGDKIDAEGDSKAIEELKRVVSVNGDLLIVLPIGDKSMIEFNAHRIYKYEQVLSMFSGLKLKEFTLIPEKEVVGGLIRNASPELVKNERYACGCFWFKK
jgi:hypothetical protein